MAEPDPADRLKERRWTRQRLITVAVWALVGAWAIWALVRLFGIERGFPAVPLIAFTPWMALASLLPLVVALLARRWAAALGAGVVVIVFASLVLPRSFGGPSEAEGGTASTMRVMAANVKYGKADAEQLLALVRKLDVDILSLEELTPKFVEKLDDAGVGELLPERLLAPSANASGGGILADRPFEKSSIGALPGSFALPRATLGRTESALPVEIVSLHTNPPTDWGVEGWTDDLEALPAPSDDVARILLGDFNATLDHAKFRDVLDGGYADAAETLGEGLTPTWPMERKVTPPYVAIDHIVADRRIGISEYSVHQINNTDHGVVFAELLLPASSN